MKRTLAFLLLFSSVHLIAQNEFISRNEFFKIRKGIVLVLPAEGGTIDLDSPTNGSWTALSDQSWLSVSPNAGTTYSLVKVTAVPNNSNLERNANVVFKTSSETVSVKIKQEGINEGTGSLSKTVNCTAGGLSSLLTAEELSTVTDLTITGTIDARDFKTMRDNMPLLSNLDISDVKVMQYIGGDGTELDDNALYLEDAIPQYAFWDYNVEVAKTSLISIKFPVSIKNIGPYAFNECSNLEGTLIIPQLVTKIDHSAFRKCIGLTGTLELPPLMETIGDYAFSSCTGFSGSLIIPNKVTTIGEYAFFNCNGFDGTLTIGTEVDSIKEFAFRQCSGFNGSLIIPNSVTYIGVNAFSRCAGFNGSLEIGDAVNKIGVGAFYMCSNLTGDINLPASMLQIEDGTFWSCFKINSIKIPKEIISIGIDVFNGCSALITVDESNPNYSSSEGVLFNKNKTRLMYCPSSKEGDYRIPISVSIVDRGSFWYSKLKSINIPGSVQIIDSNPFQANNGLIEVDSNNSNYASIDGVLFKKDYTELISCPVSKRNAYTIPKTVRMIDSLAFVLCSNLTSVTIPETIETIKMGAFAGCNGLKSMYICKSDPVDLSLSAYVFDEVDVNTCKLFVPYGSKSAYQSANRWEDFYNIFEMSGLIISSSYENLLSTNASSTSINIVTDAIWSASSNQSWLIVNPTSGTGNATITLTAEANNTASERTAIVTVSASGLPSQTITVKQAGETTGIEDLTSNPISVYPNPTTHIFAVNGFDGIATVEIFNITGELKMKYTTEANRSISVGNLTKGLYVLKISTTSGIVSKKLVIE